ncbi:MAG TPA: class I SAM-dependent methyltransferase [Chitinophagaceae bacterium]|nr:class I SAM-dependent methyltransferase [Chitinophagaceae bacterium]
MIYTIEEKNLERQHLLAEFLNPVSLNALKNISLPKDATILDVGCGLGDTTLMLNERFPGSAITGLDGDASLIEAAIEEKNLFHSNFDFVCSDALHLPFEDNSFDFVFTRYCLHHLPSALDGLKEMKRVCKSGGIIFANEPDINTIISYPESWAYQKHKEYLNLLFADALLGRKLISYFRQLQLQSITHHVESVIGDQNNNVKKFLAMTGVAIGDALMKNKLATKEEHKALLQELQRAQHDPDTIIIMAPGIAVWGTKTDTLSSNYIYQHEK